MQLIHQVMVHKEKSESLADQLAEEAVSGGASANGEEISEPQAPRDIELINGEPVSQDE